jgi:biotin carboxylase
VEENKSAERRGFMEKCSSADLVMTGMYLEKLIEEPTSHRNQVVGDAYGSYVTYLKEIVLFQRRHQTISETLHLHD